MKSRARLDHRIPRQLRPSAIKRIYEAINEEISRGPPNKNARRTIEGATERSPAANLCATVNERPLRAALNRA